MTERVVDKHKMDRRSFLKISGITALAAGLGFSLQRRVLESGKTGSYAETRYLMGTAVQMRITAGSVPQARTIVKRTFSEMERLVWILDHRQPASPLAVLNRDRKIIKAPDALRAVLAEALRIGRYTGGAFDATIKPALAQYRDHGRVPPEILERVNYEAVLLESGQVRLEVPGMEVSLDGVAKGWIVDQAVDMLGMLGVNHVLVEAGGDISMAGGKSPDRPWRVGIRHPRQSLSAVVEACSGAVATSGDYLESYHPAHLHHHILDPRQGRSPRELASATIWAEKAATADALSTAVMVLGLKEGLALVEDRPETEALLVTKEMEIHLTSNFPGTLIR